MPQFSGNGRVYGGHSACRHPLRYGGSRKGRQVARQGICRSENSLLADMGAIDVPARWLTPYFRSAVSATNLSSG